MNPSIFERGTGWTVEVHPAKEGGYWGEVPALPGCSSFGATADECRANVLEAAQGCIEVYAEEDNDKGRDSGGRGPWLNC